MNKARRARQKARKQEQPGPVLIPETEIPHLSVQAGLATATGSVRPGEEEKD